MLIICENNWYNSEGYNSYTSRKCSHDTRAFIGSQVNRDGKHAFEWRYWQRILSKIYLREERTEIYSMHARGWKIAINPFENHYVAFNVVCIVSFIIAFFYTAVWYQWWRLIHRYKYAIVLMIYLYNFIIRKRQWNVNIKINIYYSYQFTLFITFWPQSVKLYNEKIFKKRYCTYLREMLMKSSPNRFDRKSSTKKFLKIWNSIPILISL